MRPGVKIAVEWGPLVAFFAIYYQFGLMAATGVFMVATVIALSVSYGLERRLAVMPLVTGAVIMVFGGLTLWLDDEQFIKLKPTIVNCLFAAVLLGGLAMNRPLMKPLLGSALKLTDEGWRRLSLRWALFFLFLAALNELVWRTQTTDFWVNFKVFGFIPLSLVFAGFQVPLIQRHQLVEEPAKH